MSPRPGPCSACSLWRGAREVAVGIRARGIQGAQRRLNRIADRLAGVTQEAINDFADEVVDHMKGVVPVDTGKPSDSIEKKLEGESVTRQEKHTSELQSLMRTSYADFCLQQNNIT